MREILFRGKTERGEWTYGNLVCYNDVMRCILNPDEDCGYCYTVIPETVGQYTGLTDKNGKKIFEGDIVQTKYGKRYNICYDDGAFGYADGKYIIPLGDSEFGYTLYGKCDELEVIGNIHDNPELLED